MTEPQITSRFGQTTGTYGPLNDHEKLVIWSIRKWVESLRDGDYHASILHRTLESRGLFGRYVALYNMLASIADAATRVIDIRHCGCDLVSFDEHLMLQFIHCLQVQDCDAASLCLLEWVRPHETEHVLSVAGRFANLLQGEEITVAWQLDLGVHRQAEGTTSVSLH